MQLYFVADARLPTEKAHGLAIMKMCEAFTEAGAAVELLIPARRNTLHEDPFAFYGIRTRFSIRRLPCLDLYGYIPVRAAFALARASYLAALFAYVLVGRRRPVFTREAEAIAALARLGYPVFFECHAIPRRTGRFFRLVRRTRGIFASTASIHEACIEAGVPAARVTVEPSAVDLATFDIAASKTEARAALGLAQGDFLLVYTGNFTTHGEDKGLADTLRALARMPEARLLAVGGAPADCARYEALAREEGVRERAAFIGYRPQAELALYQKAADALLMPFPDTPHYRRYMTPLKMFEYLAAERPIIATDLPTIRAVLGDDTAYIIPPGRPEALAAAAAAIRTDPAAAALRARAAHALAPRYTWAARATRLLAALQ